MPHPTNSPMSRGTPSLVPGKIVEGGENKRLLNHAYYYYDAFYLGVISAGCRSILSDRECLCWRGDSPVCVKSKTFDVRRKRWHGGRGSSSIFFS